MMILVMRGVAQVYTFVFLHHRLGPGILESMETGQILRSCAGSTAPCVTGQISARRAERRYDKQVCVFVIGWKWSYGC